MLASIQKIKKVFPIEGADRIEGVEVLGWKCVVRKGIFKEGDLCIYIEIDTVIPKYLLDSEYSGDEKVRLRTVKMKGQISQGLVLSPMIPNFINSFRIIDGEDKVKNHFIVELDQDHFYIENYNDGFSFVEGQDITDILGIEKYEKSIPASLQGIIKGSFPGFLRKTDEVRIQSEPKLLELLKGKPYYITTKLDGTSATYYKLDGKFGVCSRNLELEKGDNVYWKMAEKYNIEELLREPLCFQGEIVGEGIQKNPMNIKGNELYIFNIYNIKTGLFLEPFKLGWKNQLEFNSNLKINFVPIEEYGESFNYTLEELLEKARGKYPNTNKNKEGIVVRSTDQTISFKVVNNDYLLKDEE